MNASKKVYVIGAGGHAKVVIRTLQDLGYAVAAIFDDNRQRWGASLFGSLIIGPIEKIAAEPALPTIIAVGNNSARRRIVESFTLPWLTAVHPSAFVDSSVQIGQGTVVLPRAVIQVDTVVGEHVIVNTAATIDHDCCVGNYSHLAPGVHLAGGITIGSNTLLGIGAVVIPNISIGNNATVGAGAAVIRDLPDNVVAVGVPAKVVRAAQTSMAADVPAKIFIDIGSNNVYGVPNIIGT
jgi:sugar O-acyltransferase (sialic acid O-acetyltransferase NeuD family)